jgi:hypothetical protein
MAAPRRAMLSIGASYGCNIFEEKKIVIAFIAPTTQNSQNDSRHENWRNSWMDNWLLIQLKFGN